MGDIVAVTPPSSVSQLSNGPPTARSGRRGAQTLHIPSAEIPRPGGGAPGTPPPLIAGPLGCLRWKTVPAFNPTSGFNPAVGAQHARQRSLRRGSGGGGKTS